MSYPSSLDLSFGSEKASADSQSHIINYPENTLIVIPDDSTPVPDKTEPKPIIPDPTPDPNA